MLLARVNIICISLMLAGCSDPMEWEATDENLTRLGKSDEWYSIPRVEFGDYYAVLNAKETTINAWNFLGALADVENTGFSGFCDLEKVAAFRYAIAAPIGMTFRDLRVMSSRIEPHLASFLSLKKEACSNYSRYLNNQLLEVSATVPLLLATPRFQNGKIFWEGEDMPSTVAVTNNSTKTLTWVNVSWEMGVLGRVAPLGRGALYFEIIGGLEPGESFTRQFGRETGFKGFGNIAEKIGDVAELFGKNQLFIRVCVDERGGKKGVDCLEYEESFQGSYKHLVSIAGKLQAIKDHFYEQSELEQSSIQVAPEI